MLFFRDVHVEEEVAPPAPLVGEEEAEAEEKPSVLVNRKIPLLLFTSSLVTALGSGASVKFFPLFFKDNGLSPQNVQWIFVLSPLCIAAFTVVAKKVADKIGRIRASVYLESCGALLLMLMAFLHHRGVSDPWIMVPVYLLRTALMNCTYPIIESVLMSSVPSDERSRWKSLESIAAFSWTGSAVLGGVMSDARGYAFAFAITSVVQLIGTWIIFPLDSLVPREEEDESPPKKPVDSSSSSSSAIVDLTEPLIQPTSTVAAA
jgi:MFS family permease